MSRNEKRVYECPTCDTRVIRCTDVGVAIVLLCDDCNEELQYVEDRRVEYDLDGWRITE